MNIDINKAFTYYINKVESSCVKRVMLFEEFQHYFMIFLQEVSPRYNVLVFNYTSEQYREENGVFKTWNFYIQDILKKIQ